MSSPQLTGWLAFFELEPFGAGREDLRAGLVASVVANSAFGRGKGAKTYKPSDFFENLREPTKPMTAADMAAIAKGLTRAMGGKVTTRDQRAAEAKSKAEAEAARAAKAAAKAKAKPAPQAKSGKKRRR